MSEVKTTLETNAVENLPVLEEVPEGATLIAEVDGEFYRVKGEGVGGGLPEGGEPFQQLVTDANGAAKWEDRERYDLHFYDYTDKDGYMQYACRESLEEIQALITRLEKGELVTGVYRGVTGVVRPAMKEPTIGDPAAIENPNVPCPHMVFAYLDLDTMNGEWKMLASFIYVNPATGFVSGGGSDYFAYSD